jgi:NAD(P)-dependent dehydrogenase (short-subunit alcohol dehydrogenase family)
MGELTGRTILLTGASRGIGAATARVLGERGAHLVAHYGSHRAGAEEGRARSGARRSRGAAGSTS